MTNRIEPPAGESRENGGSTVIAGILSYLQDRRLQPGDRLPSERDLAERLGVGRNALREALATLAALRIVESRPNSGIYLRHVAREGSFEALILLTELGGSPTAIEVAETMEVRAHLETLAVGLACKRRTDEDLERMADVLSRTQEVLAHGGNIASADTDFHVALVGATHNSVLVRVLNAFYRFTGQRRELMFEDLSQAEASLSEHRRLLEHVAARDSAKGQLLILRHMDRARSYWSTVLEK